MPPRVTTRGRLHSACFEVCDTSVQEVDVTSLAAGGGGRDPTALAEIRAQALLEQNAGILRDFEVEAHVRSARGQTKLVVSTGGTVGAIPLLSPLTARVDYGMIIRPRFGWSSIGDVLWQTGLRTVPDILPLPPLPSSERRVPPWVLSAVVINRLEALLQSLDRSFVMVEADRRRPRGRVDWPRYARTRVGRGQPHVLPCRFQDLLPDEPLLRAISFTLRHHQALLRSQHAGGQVVHYLLRRCEAALRLLGPIEPQAPTERTRFQWRSRPLAREIFSAGLEAIDWTLDERGLAGLEDLGGLPWRLSMDQFFETWIEMVGEHLGRLAGLSITTGRGEQTRTPLHWVPEWLGSQRSLLPDVILQGVGVAIVLDAKYKRHLDAFSLQEWSQSPEHLRESHRHDLLQVLAYSSLLDCPRVVACLVYPCLASTYEFLRRSGATFARARLRAGSRSVDLALAAAPLHEPAESIARSLFSLIRSG